MHVPLLTYLGLVSQLLVVVTATLRYRSVSGEMKLLAVFFGVSLFISLLQVALALNAVNNLWILHFFNLLSFCIYLFVFSYWQPDANIGRMFRREFIFAYCVIWLLSKVSIESFLSFDYFSSGLGNVVMVFIVCYTMISSVDRSSAALLYDRFLILSGVLISSISSAVVNSSANLISSLQHDEMLKIW